MKKAIAVSSFVGIVAVLLAVFAILCTAKESDLQDLLFFVSIVLGILCVILYKLILNSQFILARITTGEVRLGYLSSTMEPVIDRGYYLEKVATGFEIADTLPHQNKNSSAKSLSYRVGKNKRWGIVDSSGEIIPIDELSGSPDEYKSQLLP